MSSRKAAPLSASLLARKGDARPAGAPAEPQASSEVPQADAAAPSPARTAPAAQVASAEGAAAPGASVAPAPDVHAYGWPTTQGVPPTEAELTMPPPPETAEPASQVRGHPGRIRRWAMFALAGAVALTAGGLLLRDKPQPSREVVAEIPPKSLDPVNAPAPAEPAELLRLEQIAPAAGTPAAPAARATPPAAPATPATRAVAALPPPASEPLPAIDAATLVPPPLDPPAPRVAAGGAPSLPSKPEAAASPPTPARPAPQREARAASARPAAAAVSGAFALQLASVGSKARAEAESARLAKSLTPVLGGRKPSVQEGTVSGKGTVYRIRVAGFADKPAAERACRQVKGRGQDCLVVKR